MQIDCDLMKLYYLNHSTHEPWHSLFIILYTILICTAFVFNSLVLCAVYRKSLRHDHGFGNYSKTRNILIGQLCTLDVLLAFTMPWTAVDALTKFWAFGFETEMLCKFTKSASAAVVYSSSMMIIVIAIDSYRRIVHSSELQLSPSNIFKMTPVILVIALLMAFPMFYNTQLISPDEVNADQDTMSSNKNINTTVSSTFHTDIAAAPHTESSESTTPKVLTAYNVSSATSVSKFNVSEPNLENNMNNCGDIDNDGRDDWSHVVYCVEDWQFREGDHDPTNRIYYSIFSLTVQYCIPVTTISILYFLVYIKLRKMNVVRKRMMKISEDETNERSNDKRTSSADEAGGRKVMNISEEEGNEQNDTKRTRSAEEAKRTKEDKRARRINGMLITISMVFCFCWLPLNLIGTLMDLYPYLFGTSTETMTIIFMTCHIIGMCSACINPVIYGFCNETIKTGNVESYITYNQDISNCTCSTYSFLKLVFNYL